MPVLKRVVAKRRRCAANAGIVHTQIELAEGIDGELNGLLDLIGLCNINGHRRRLSAIVSDRINDVLGRIKLEIGHNDLCAARGQLACHSFTNAGSGACY